MSHVISFSESVGDLLRTIDSEGASLETTAAARKLDKEVQFSEGQNSDEVCKGDGERLN